MSDNGSSGGWPAPGSTPPERPPLPMSPMGTRLKRWHVVVTGVLALFVGVALGGSNATANTSPSPLVAQNTVTATVTANAVAQPTVTLTRTVPGPTRTVVVKTTVVRSVAAAAPAAAAQVPSVSPPAPAPSSAPVVAGNGATALCNDGTLSYAAHHQGACSHHGGVSIFYK